jgi:hypothetical protein
LFSKTKVKSPTIIPEKAFDIKHPLKKYPTRGTYRDIIGLLQEEFDLLLNMPKWAKPSLQF